MATPDLSNIQIDLSGLDIQTEDQPQGGIVDRGWNALRSGVGGILESGAVTAEELGASGVASAARSLQPQLPQGYQSPGARFINQGGEGYEWDSFLEAIVEQVPQIGLSLGTRAAGAAAGFAVGGVPGAAIGAFSGPALSQAFQIVGPVARERAQRAGKQAPDYEDWAWAVGTAVASGALESIGIGKLVGKGAGGAVSRVISEAFTEGSQGFAEQVGSTAGTPGGIEIDLKQAAGEALIGGGAGVGPAVVSRGIEGASQASSDGPTRATAPEDVELAERIRNQTNPDGTPLDLGLRDKGVDGGAVNAVQNARAEILAEAGIAIDALRKLARAQGDTEALRDLEVFNRKAFQRNDTNASETDYQRFQERFGDTEEGQKVISLARQRARIQPFLKPQGTYGGWSAYTRFLDPTEKSATGFQRAMGTLANIGLGGTGFLINRAARGIDRLTGRYSPVERFVRSAEGQEAPTYTGESAVERVSQLREEQTRNTASEESWRTAAAMETERLGREVSPEELRKRVEAQTILAKLRSAEERIANAEQGPENRAARSARNQAAQVKAAVEQATAPQPTAENQTPTEDASLNARQDTGQKVPGMERWGVTQDAVANELAWINGDDSAFTALDDYNGNQGTYRTAKGRAAKIAIGQLKKDLSAAGMNSTQAATYFGPLEEMDDPTVLKPKRRLIFSKLQEDLEDLGLSGDPFVERTLRIGSTLVEAGGYKVPDEYREAAEQSKASDDPEVKKLREDLNEIVKTIKALSKVGTQQPVINITIPGIGPVATANAYVASGGQVVPAAENSGETDPAVAGKELTTPVEPAPPSEASAKPAPPAGTTKSYEKEKRKAERGDMRRAKTITQKVAKQEAQLERAYQLAPRIGEVQQAINALESAEGPVNQLKALILESGTEFQTFMGLSYAYANKYGVSQAEAAPIVRDAIIDLFNEGVIFQPKRADEGYRIKGRRVKSVDDRYLDDIHLRFNSDNPFYELVEISKAAEKVRNLPNVSEPHAPLDATNGFRSSISVGIDGFTAQQKAQAAPIIDFLNFVRSTGTGLNTRLFETLLKNMGENNNLAVEDALHPKDSDGKRRDMTSLYAMALLKHQFPQMKDGVFYQEAHADSRGRVYTRNGTASTQTGDLMKALTRAPFKAPPGEVGLNKLFQSWGNLVGPDGKASIEDRIKAYKAAVPKLLKLAESPFPKDGKYAPELEDLFQEGQLQTIAVALDTKDMIDFASKRHPKVKRDKLLNDPAVLKDIAENWKTDAVAQFDGNNNAFQIQGGMLGDASVLMATSVMPKADAKGPATSWRVEDIYLQPAINAVETELSAELGEAIKTPEGRSWLRNAIKNSVTTYVYDSTIAGASRSVLSKLVKNYSYVSPDFLKSARQDVKKSGDTTTFSFDKKKFRVAKEGDQWSLQIPSTQKAGEWHEIGLFKTEKLALDFPVLQDFAGTLTGAVRRNVESMYPRLRLSMNFFRKMAEWGRWNGNKPIRYRTPDGIEFTYESDDAPKFKAMEFKFRAKNGKFYTAHVPVVTEKSLSGRGLSANVTHAHDAYVMREGIKRSGVSWVNPIHDSFGFHPSEAEKGLNGVLEVLGEIGSSDWDVYEDMIAINQIPIIEIADHQPPTEKGEIQGAMREAIYNSYRAELFQRFRQEHPRAKDTTIQGMVDRYTRNIIVIPKRRKINPISPDQMLNAIS